MNRKQLIILWVGIAVFALVGLNPRPDIRYAPPMTAREEGDPPNEPWQRPLTWGPSSMKKLVAGWGATAAVTAGLIVAGDVIRVRPRNVENTEGQKIAENSQATATATA